MEQRVRADLTRRELVRTHEAPWVDSPAVGVERKMLDRVGGEVARATTVVRFAPGSVFPRHVHELGEEFIVLEGIFSDEEGDYPPGTYVRNPPGSAHAPRSRSGCTLWVKLRQMDLAENDRVVVDTAGATFSRGQVEGLSVLGLHEAAGVHTALVRWAPGTRFVQHRHWGGEEIFVLSGEFCDEHGRYPAGTWIRSPHLSEHHPYSELGCLIYVKTGHLI